MAANIPNLPMLLSTDSQNGIMEFYKQAVQTSEKLWNLRNQFERADRAYMREMDNTTEQQRATLSNIYGDPTKFRNIVVPVVLPQVEGAVVYQTSVFLTGHPIVASVAPPEFQDEAMAMNSLIEDQQTRGQWVGEFMNHFRNGFKYNLAALEVDWSRKVTASLETNLTVSDKEAIPKEIIWEGNTVRNLDLYNSFWDTRVLPTEVHSQGEFAGYMRLMSRVALKVFLSSLPYNTNVKQAFESAVAGEGSYYKTPIINPNSFMDTKDVRAGEMNWMAWVTASKAEVKIEYKDMYEVSTLYARIIPSDFKIRVPSANTPQIWKFIIVNHSVIVYAERQTNAHEWIPVLFSQPLFDGLGYQTKSLANNVEPFQAITSALWNSVIASRRRAISDRGLYDPSRVDAKHINSDVPNAKIPVRPNAYGKPLGESYYPIPYRDDQSGILMQESQNIVQMANMVSGQNQVRQGQFVKGNKTQREFDTVMGNANGRDQTTSLLLESQLFTPFKEIVRLNNLQYQGGTTIYNREEGRVVEVDPVKLRKAVLSFKMSDGLLPTDKLINGEVFQQAIQAISTSPEIQGQYNIAPMFSYLMKTRGADLKPFEKSAEQVAYEQAVRAWQQVVQEAIKGGATKDQLPPQPMPQQFNYVPSNQVGTAPAGTASQAPEASTQPS